MLELANCELHFIMPKKSKKKQFRGVPYWKKNSAAMESGGTPVSHTTTVVTDSPEERRALTASESKIKLPASNKMNPVSKSDMTKGYCLIDLECLDEALRNSHICDGGKSLCNSVFFSNGK